MSVLTYPQIIQGGMGVNISDWNLARTVSLLGQQGTISGVALEKILVIVLQRGDVGGHFRRALSHFPFPNIVQEVLDKYFVDGGIAEGAKIKKAPLFTVEPSAFLIGLTVCANYTWVWLAKEGHANPVSINFLEKIAMPHLYAIFGAMLAGVDFITMGAGIPIQVPEVIKNFTAGKEAQYCIPVSGETIKSYVMKFDPRKFFGQDLDKVLPLKNPGFIPIISSVLLGKVLKSRLPEGSVYGFVVEEPTAGGHNAPPRKGDAYGPKDVVDYSEVNKLGLPFWIGGSYASPERLKLAQSLGAKGVQVGGIYALCEESGMDPEIRRRVRSLGWKGELQVRTDMRISSSGFPFKVVSLAGTLSEQSIYDTRSRLCDRGALVSLYEKSDGTVGYRCPAEPVEVYLRKGGKIEETIGRGCLCNGLITAAGLSEGYEPAIVTLGDDFSFLRRLMITADGSYGAREATNYLLGQ